MVGRLVGVRAKIERAKHHVRDFENRVQTFRDADPYRLVIENDAKAGQRIYKVHVHSQPPASLPLIAGEAICQLRSSLDHLAWQLVEANGVTPGNGTYFPISETAAKYKKVSPGKVKGMSAGAISLIDAIKPYQGGCDELWKLHALNNIDKHRLLLVVACDVEAAIVTLSHGPPTPMSAFIKMGRPGTSLPSRKLKVLENGAEIGRISGQLLPDVNVDLKAPFEIAFGEPQIVEGEATLPFLHQLTHLVDSIVTQFEPFL
jgi:hypothetical protein